MCCSSSTTLEEKPRKKLIVKIRFPSQKPKSQEHDHDSDSSSKRRKIQHDEKPKPIVTCYWVDASAKHPTTTLSHAKKDDNVVENHKNMINNHVSKTSVKESSQLKEDSTITTTLLSRQKANNVHTLKRTRTAVSDDERYPKISSFAKETSRVSDKLSKESPKHGKGSTTMSQEKSDGEKGKKKPMERVKRWRCWVMLKRMMEGRDSWAVKEPLKDVEDKLRVYSNPKEFAYDMRHVFSNVLSLNPPRTEIYKVAKRLCDCFEERWKTLNDEWALDNRKGKKIHKTKRKLF